MEKETAMTQWRSFFFFFFHLCHTQTGRLNFSPHDFISVTSFEVSHQIHLGRHSDNPFITMAQTQIPVSSLEKIASGKVRDLFKLPDADTLLFVASDRVSAFDVVMENGIPDKGKILNLISAHWFEVLMERIPDLRTHFITLDVPAGATPEEAKAIKDRSMQVRRLQVVKLESIV